MLTIEEMEDLPEDPELAFLTIEEKCRRKLLDKVNSGAGNAGSPGNSMMRGYFITVGRAMEELGVDVDFDLRVADIIKKPNGVGENFSQFLSAVDYCIAGINIRIARRLRRYSVKLDASAKSQLRQLVEQVTAIVTRMEIPEWKRARVEDRVADFAAELDVNRTRLEILGAFLLGLTDAGVQTGNKFDELSPVLSKMIKIMARAKETEDNASLMPRAAEPRRLQPPPGDGAATADDAGA